MNLGKAVSKGSWSVKGTGARADITWETESRDSMAPKGQRKQTLVPIF